MMHAVRRVTKDAIDLVVSVAARTGPGHSERIGNAERGNHGVARRLGTRPIQVVSERHHPLHGRVDGSVRRWQIPVNTGGPQNRGVSRWRTGITGPTRSDQNSDHRTRQNPLQRADAMPGHANHLTHGLDATPAVSVPRNGRVSMVVTSLA